MWVEDVDVSAIEAADISPSAIEDAIASLVPSLHTFIWNVIISILIYIIGRKLIGIILKVLKKFLSHTGLDDGVSSFLMSAARMLLYTLMIFMIIAQLGVNTASIITILGTAGLAISMSLQGSLSNVAGGILILMMKPFMVGDYVTTSYGEGTVQAIGLVYTTLMTKDNRKLSIPNGVLSNSAVTDASAMPERRLDTAVGISYDSDLRKAKRIMEEAYRSCPGFLADKEVNVHVSSFEDSSVMVEAFGWVKRSEFLNAKWYVLEEIKLRFDEEGITIPFPQMDVHLDPSKHGLSVKSS